MDAGEVHEFRPGWTLRPGVLLREELRARGWTAEGLAGQGRLAPGVVEGVLAGTWRVDGPVARGIGDALGTTPEMWLNAQRLYDEAIARGAKDMSEEHKDD